MFSSTLSCHALSVFYTFGVRGQASHRHKIAGKLAVSLTAGESMANDPEPKCNKILLLSCLHTPLTGWSAPRTFNWRGGRWRSGYI